MSVKKALIQTAIILSKIIAVFLLLIILLAIIFRLPLYIDGQRNKKVIIKYIEENYGTDYIIVDEILGTSGASGRRSDTLTILQDGITYEVSAKKGEIIWDSYDYQIAEKNS
ncbi:MAG: hypothetical protein FWD48_08270 [Oscillospiraceae bacterium]|nr:hypothetical protein [Oscillospiraceae bacterium]